MHLLAAIPDAGKYLELSIEDDDCYPWQRDLFPRRPIAVTDDHVTVTDAPGWGGDVNPAWLDRATHTDAAMETVWPSAYGALDHKAGKAWTDQAHGQDAVLRISGDRGRNSVTLPALRLWRWVAHPVCFKPRWLTP